MPLLKTYENRQHERQEDEVQSQTCQETILNMRLLRLALYLVEFFAAMSVVADGVAHPFVYTCLF